MVRPARPSAREFLAQVEAHGGIMEDPDEACRATRRTWASKTGGDGWVPEASSGTARSTREDSGAAWKPSLDRSVGAARMSYYPSSEQQSLEDARKSAARDRPLWSRYGGSRVRAAADEEVPTVQPPQGEARSDELAAATKVTHAITVQGPVQALAMLTGRKLVENRGWQIPPGWYALHVGQQRNSEWGQKAEAICPDLPPESDLQSFFGAIVGLLHIVEQRTVEECRGNEWAYGPVCHVVSHGVRFKNPIRQRGAQGLWELPDEVHPQVMMQLRGGSVARHDLSKLGASPNRAPGEHPKGRGGFGAGKGGSRGSFKGGGYR
eukprot:gnl/TRDRNA2_/TRDRNA2_192325_c0_seq1.p1 gnl/TRDRNA2_/TRDRNA2_192325_c0~~gnl/TRDRNA2_/TRDRNA2_192325_c0_seq1.p1  ORF type:complete len:332 (-),score=53.46 gnl/TRDRNA2_/TRDRNA2_192325_c0_seq1:20-985(-)